MKCRAKKYVNKTKETTDCLKESEYGMLCGTHARQLAGTPSGFGYNKVRRVHLSELTDEEVENCVKLYTEIKGVPMAFPNDPMTYCDTVINFLSTCKNNVATTGEIIQCVNSVSGAYLMTASKVGAILRVLKARGLVTRKLITVYHKDGRRQGSACYELS
jgi:hypothetical protein